MALTLLRLIENKLKRLLLIILLSPSLTLATESTCYGTTANGRLEKGVQLPASGPNYVTYSRLATGLGRTYVHSAVKKIILESYVKLEITAPTKVYKYAETGPKNGGEFKPHKTHRNGLSVDFMVPVTENSLPTHLPTSPLNKFGYNIEFDKNSRYKQYKIDYDAMAHHIMTLDKTAKASGYSLKRVIFAPELQWNLFKTKYGDYLKKNIRFSKKRAWVRHDEHYHVDFKIPCQAL